MSGFYSAYRLLETDRKLLLDMHPPKYENVRCDHVTVETNELLVPPVPLPYPLAVVGYLDAGDLELFLVEVNGRALRPHGGFFHITISTDRGVRSHESNRAIPRCIDKMQPIFIGIGGEPYVAELQP